MNKEAAEVKLINYTTEALDLLIFTKSGRLEPGATFADVKRLSQDEKIEHLSYMMDTIKTSFEFIDYVFEIKNVSRAFTHQIVRTRTASFQQQAMRVVDARDFGCLVSTDEHEYAEALEFTKKKYGELIDKGIAVQDARGILPTAIHTQIMVKANLRTLSNMAELRLCKRAEGEYQSVFKKMVEAVTKVHPWAAPLLTVACVRTGICSFPRYDKCPVQEYTIKVTEERKRAIQQVWKYSNHVAAPQAVNAMTM